MQSNLLVEEKENKLEEKNYDLLIAAIKDNDVEKVKRLLEKGYDPNTFVDVSSCLSIACKCDYAEIAKCLVENGADINYDSQQAIHKAASKLNLELVDYLLQQAGYCHSSVLTQMLSMLCTGKKYEEDQKLKIGHIIDLCFYYGGAVGFDFSERFYHSDDDKNYISLESYYLRTEPWEKCVTYFENKVIIGSREVHRLYAHPIETIEKFWDSIPPQEYAHWLRCFKHILKNKPSLHDTLAPLIDSLARHTFTLRERCQEKFIAACKTESFSFKNKKGKICPTFFRIIPGQEKNSRSRWNLFFKKGEKINPVFQEEFAERLFTDFNDFLADPKKTIDDIEKDINAKAIQYYNEGKFTQAIICFQLALDYRIYLAGTRISPEIAVACHNLARAYEKSGHASNYIEAVYLFENAAMIYERLDKRANARKYKQKIDTERKLAEIMKQQVPVNAPISFERALDDAYLKVFDYYAQLTKTWGIKERTGIVNRLRNRGVHIDIRNEHQLRNY